MSEILAKMCDVTARQLEKRAEGVKNPEKRQKILDKAAKERQQAEVYRRVKDAGHAPPQAPQTGPMQGAGPPHPGQRPGPGMPPAGMHPMDAPTHQLRHVPPGAGQPPGRPPRQGFAPAGQPAPAPAPAGSGSQEPGGGGMSRAKKVGIGVVAVFALIGAVSVFGNGDAVEDGFDRATAPTTAAPPAAAPAASGPDPQDLQACQRAGEVMRDWGALAQGVGDGSVGLPQLARETTDAMDGMSEVPIIANDADVIAASRALTGQFEMIAAAARRGDISALSRLASEGGSMATDVATACRGAVT
ncbi:hypothetical protein [Pseudonocardia spirodelae]|uniref:Uncharacterized protein n=1 Tax=Pseudonocardia spirodelae TaxID=3133431 RepID=A0ABU8T3N0_9PSEU